MKIFPRILILIIALKALVKSCPLSRTYDLTFFITSSTNDVLTCSTRSAVYAVVSPYAISSPPVMTSIWDSTSDQNSYHCIMTKYFFVPGRPTAATIDEFTDDYVTIKINDVQVAAISTNSGCTYQLNKDVFSYIKPGLNSLYIDAQNTGGPGFFGYRLTIKTQLS
ncbi:hypothetical protein SteCoe_7776 [Stentor coeruleus]|uniref:Uncharacterized protein n=1 Tax=Stentor coeruleus TaxID=5963 RepID=A0A1R2CLU6_9CILI|nr:hypothetical protein SteCoe_7776 [Stentor coeruleus]